MATTSRQEFCLLAWGANSYGQHGQGHEEDQAIPRLSNKIPLHGRSIRAVSGGGGHSVVVTDDGEAFVCGQNLRGQLGLGHTANCSTLQHCSGLNQRVTNVACGWDFTLVLTDSGNLLACGSNVFGQLGVGQMTSHSAQLLLIESLKERVLSIAAGLRHSLAITESGHVYQWGTGLRSLAKRALSPDPVPSHLNSKVPSLVPGLDLKVPHAVTAGSAHCVCLTDGDLFLWGSNKHSQLTATEPFLSTPAPLKRSLLGGEKVVEVSSGWTHVIAQTESGRVFTWGRGNYGQLGRPLTNAANPKHRSADHSSQTSMPAEAKALFGATQIACGSEHNLAIVGERLLSWGWNEHGMCGDGSLADILEPRIVPGLRPLVIGCGAGHSLAVCAGNTCKDQ
ncbi:secretion-regulating guanine nucleotide exchange factor isoform X2 [Syngnathoides biaculeatus]|uniref:secretion-regulating guanine nucleotide exchange factor isoform X2 n=1 Tax=Syngnathoides biaculeatus TaxID=300417 RepID=UPI002ADE819A|nr:secretion-regulating guanine nucleotide exchange factor isoform X2 [Syngnathoides biaculeatus]